MHCTISVCSPWTDEAVLVYDQFIVEVYLEISSGFADFVHSGVKHSGDACFKRAAYLVNFRKGCVDAAVS